MPSKSKKQHNLMALVANDPKAAKRLGIPKSVGEEFMKADKGKKFGKGGYAAGGCATKAEAKSIAKKEVKGHEKSMHKMKKGGVVEKGTGEKYASKAAMMRHEKKESKAEEMKEHGKVKRMFGGGISAPIGGMAAGMRNLAKNVAASPKTFSDAMKAVALRGGSLKGGPKTFPGQKAPTRMGGMGMKKGGKVKKYAEGGSVGMGKKPAESDYDKKLREEALSEMRDKKMRENMGKAYDKSREQSLGAPEKKMRSGGSCGTKKYARGGGIEVRGKTKGKMV